MTDRVPCHVPGCGRSIAKRRLKPGHNEWLCAGHWGLVPRERRRVFFLAQRRGNDRAAAFIWARLTRLAVERAAGL